VAVGAGASVDRAQGACEPGEAMAPPLLPITRLIACPVCGEHIKSNESVCPHCGSQVRGADGGLLRAASAVLVGLALAGCPEKEPDPTTSGASESGSSGSGSGESSGTTVVPEPEYGAPVTTGVSGEQDYGVPATDSMSGTVTGASGEQDYGVPATDSASGSGTGGSSGTTSGGEPLYGAGDGGA